jgi:transcriptional regulator with PAS, ATPase and Fis domain
MSEPSDKQERQNEADFQRWLDGELTPEQSAKFEQGISDSPQFKARLATARFIEQQVYCYEEQPVDEWDRGAAFVHDKRPWWQWSGVPLLSMACSFLALTLVIFKVEFVIQDSGVLLTFGGDHQTVSSQQVEELMDQRLKDFAGEQQLVMANFTHELTQRQQDNNLQLANYIINTSRQERKQDMTDFISYINEQRKDDQFEQKMRFSQLEYNLQQQQAALPLQQISQRSPRTEK